MKQKNKKILINTIIILLILGIMIWIAIDEYEIFQIEEKDNSNMQTELLNSNINKVNEELKNNTDAQFENKQNSQIRENVEKKESIIQSYKGYLVSSKLEIPSINLQTYVLREYSEQSLNISVTKFFGADANEIGNLCIAGHNFKKDNMFYNLRKVKIGDKLYITDNKYGKKEYQIYSLFKVLPEDVSCLDQETGGKRIVTLITCTTDSKERIIAKAEEV